MSDASRYRHAPRACDRWYPIRASRRRLARRAAQTAPQACPPRSSFSRGALVVRRARAARRRRAREALRLRFFGNALAAPVDVVVPVSSGAAMRIADARASAIMDSAVRHRRRQSTSAEAMRSTERGAPNRAPARSRLSTRRRRPAPSSRRRARDDGRRTSPSKRARSPASRRASCDGDADAADGRHDVWLDALPFSAKVVPAPCAATARSPATKESAAVW